MLERYHQLPDVVRHSINIVNGGTNYVTKIASLLVIATGLLFLAGWFLDISIFKSVLPGIISMKINTAVCLILSGFILYLPDVPDGGQRRKNSSCDFLLPGLKYNMNEFNRLINDFSKKSFGKKSPVKLISLSIGVVNRF